MDGDNEKDPLVKAAGFLGAGFAFVLETAKLAMLVAGFMLLFDAKTTPEMLKAGMYIAAYFMCRVVDELKLILQCFVNLNRLGLVFMDLRHKEGLDTKK